MAANRKVSLCILERFYVLHIGYERGFWCLFLPVDEKQIIGVRRDESHRVQAALHNRKCSQGSQDCAFQVNARFMLFRATITSTSFIFSFFLQRVCHRISYLTILTLV